MAKTNLLTKPNPGDSFIFDTNNQWTVAPASGTAFGNNYTFSNSNNVSFTNNSSVIVGSASFPAQSSLVYSNSNGVSFGLSGSTLTASVSANTQYVFSNSNGLSFGTAGSTVTGSYSVPSTAGLISGINVSAGTTSNNVSALTFSNSNGLGFGFDGSNITGSYTLPVLSSLSATGAVSISSNGNTISIGAPVVSSLSATGIVSISSNGNTISIGAPIQSVNFSAGSTSNNASNIVFSNSNNFSFGLSGSTITASYTVPSTAGLISAIKVSAGTVSNNLSAITFSNSNGLSFGLTGSTLTGSYTVPSTAGLISAVNISAGTASNNLTNLVFSNSNNFSFGLTGSTITGSYTVPTQTNQTAGLYALGNTTQNSSTTLDVRTMSFNALGAMTWGYSNGSIQVSAPVVSSLSATGAVSISSNGNTISIGAPAVSSLSATGIVSISSNGNTISIGAPIQSVNFSAGTTSNNYTNIVFSNSNNVSFGLSGSTITGSVLAQSAQTQNIVVPTAGTQTATSGTVAWSNSNNITFGMSGSSRITASYNFSISGGTSTGFGNGITFTNSNNMSFTNNAGVIAAKAAPKASEVINDSIVSGTTAADALNNLLLEFPNGITSEASNFSLSIGLLGQLILVTGANLTITIPTLGSSNISQGSRFSIILSGSGTIAAISGAGGVTVHNPTNFATAQYSRFDLECIGSDIWKVTSTPFNLTSDSVLNASTVTGTAVSDALNQVQVQSFHGTLMIPLHQYPNANDISTFFNITAAGGVSDQTPGATFVGMIGPLPAGISINSFSITIKPAGGHAGLPTTMPAFAVYSNFNGTINTIATASDTSANVTAYQLQHTITASFTAQVSIGTSFWFYFVSEHNFQSLVGLQLISASVNVV